jgi:hypothetical protein
LYEEECEDIPKMECHTRYEDNCTDEPEEVKKVFKSINLLGSNFCSLLISI